MFSLCLLEKHFERHCFISKWLSVLQEMNHLKSILWAGTNYSSCVILFRRVLYVWGEQHKHRRRALVGTSPCCCRHNGLGLFALPARLLFLLLFLNVIACHAKIQHNDSCDHQTQWTGMFTEIGFGAQRNSRYCSESHICLAITRTSQHLISILPHVIALFCVCQSYVHKHCKPTWKPTRVCS